jgi:hypothetical protein
VALSGRLHFWQQPAEAGWKRSFNGASSSFGASPSSRVACACCAVLVVNTAGADLPLPSAASRRKNLVFPLPEENAVKAACLVVVKAGAKPALVRVSIRYTLVRYRRK